VLGSESSFGSSRSPSTHSCSAIAIARCASGHPLARSCDSLPNVDAHGERLGGAPVSSGPGAQIRSASHPCAPVAATDGAATAPIGSMVSAASALGRPHAPAQRPLQSQRPARGDLAHPNAKSRPDGATESLATTQTPLPCERPPSSATPPPPSPLGRASSGCPYQQNMPHHRAHNIDGGDVLTAPGTTVAIGAMCATLAAVVLRSGVSARHRRRRAMLLLLASALAVPRLRSALLRAMAFLDWVTSARLPTPQTDSCPTKQGMDARLRPVADRRDS